VNSYIETRTLRATPFFSVAFLCVATFLAAIAWYIAYSGEPLHQPGTTYSTGFFGSGTNLRLLDSGKFIRQNYCDICGTIVLQGSWETDAGNVVLTPDARSAHGFHHSVLRKADIRGCAFLVDETGMPLGRRYDDQAKDKACQRLAERDVFKHQDIPR
jgi:hypothetical protein